MNGTIRQGDLSSQCCQADKALGSACSPVASCIQPGQAQNLAWSERGKDKGERGKGKGKGKERGRGKGNDMMTGPWPLLGTQFQLMRSMERCSV